MMAQALDEPSRVPGYGVQPGPSGWCGHLGDTGLYLFLCVSQVKMLSFLKSFCAKILQSVHNLHFQTF